MVATSMQLEITPTAEPARSSLRRMMWRLRRYQALRKGLRAAQIPRLQRNPRHPAVEARLHQALPRRRARMQRDGGELLLSPRY